MVWEEILNQYGKRDKRNIGVAYNFDGFKILGIYHQPLKEDPSASLELLSLLEEDQSRGTLASYNLDGSGESVRLENFRGIESQLRELRRHPDYGRLFGSVVDEIFEELNIKQ